ncbi:MAG: O-antigen ligase family protein [Candidatus Portnoybacteria bacterium]|nr:O-antigen ligase family protein [Candidatus Portnoybacteria bacterium]
MNSLAQISSSSKEKITPFWRYFEIAFLLLILYLPFQIALNPAGNIDLASIRVFVLLFFLVWFFYTAFFKKENFSLTFQGFGLVAFLIIGGLSLLLAQEFEWGWRKFLFLLSIFPLYFLAVGLANKPDYLKKVVGIFIWSAALAALAGLIQFIIQSVFGPEFLANIYSQRLGPLFWGKNFSSLVISDPSWLVNVAGQTHIRAFGLFPDPHMMAFFMGLSFPIVFAQLLFRRSNNLKLLAIFCLLFVVLLLTFSRGGYLGFLAAAAIIILVSWRLLERSKKKAVLVSVIFFAIVISIFAQPVTARFLASFSPDEGSSSGRLAIWQDSWKVFLGHPILGVGLGNYPREADSLIGYRSSITSHNLYLDIASEIGFFGLAIWLILVFGSIFQLYKSIKRHKNQESNNFLLAVKIGLLGSLVYFSVHSFFETPIFNPVILAAFMIILALASLVAKYGYQH